MDCATTLLAGGGLASGCAGALLSKVLGYAVVAGSAALKLPQIANVLASKSADGLSRASLEAETVGYFVSLAYSMVRGMAFNAYGECLFLLLQDVVLLFLVTSLGDQRYLRLVLIIALLGGIGGSFYNELLATATLEYAYSGMNVVFYYARAQQIWENFRASSTGQLSLISSSLLLVGNSVRVLTTLQEGGGTNMLVGFVISFLLNLFIVLQIFFTAQRSRSNEHRRVRPLR